MTPRSVHGDTARLTSPWAELTFLLTDPSGVLVGGEVGVRQRVRSARYLTPDDGSGAGARAHGDPLR
jgi:hypothetical protein